MGTAERVTPRETVVLEVDVDIGGVLWPGSIADLDSASLAADPLALPGARAIRMVERIPSLRDPTRAFRRAYL